MNKLLLLSGTSEGPILARALVQAGFQVRATVTRPEARDRLFGKVPDIAVEVRGFTDETLTDFLGRGEADIVLDATHPFAVRITRIAHQVCTRLGVPYVRYERPDWDPPQGTLFADGFPQAAAMLPALGQRILLTIGSKQLKHFASFHESLILFARVLPSPISINQARQAGFPLDRILPLRPPFSREFNRSVFWEHAFQALVTKASGLEGGVPEKVQAARDLNMQVLMIRRPPEQIPTVNNLEQAVAECLVHR